MIQLQISLTVQDAVQHIQRAVCGSGTSVELIDQFIQQGSTGSVAVLVFDKYFMRNSSRASLTVTIADITGRTTVRAVGSGGSQGSLLNFDWGAAESFENTVKNALLGVLR